MTDQPADNRHPSRRTLVRGAAWSIPVVVAAGAAPAFAASPPPDVVNWQRSSACKMPGGSHKSLGYDKGYVLWSVFENPTSQDLQITVTGLVAGGVPLCLVGLADTAVNCTAPIGRAFTVPAGGMREIGIYGNSSTNSSSTHVVVNYTYAYGGQAGQPGSSGGDVIGSTWQGSCRHACAGGKPMSARGTPCESSAQGKSEADAGQVEQGEAEPRSENESTAEPADAGELGGAEPEGELTDTTQSEATSGAASSEETTAPNG